MTTISEEIDKIWAEDKSIDITNLTKSITDIPELHHKYYIMYNKYHMKTMKLRSDLIMLIQKKTEYYNGSISEEDLKLLGWKPNPLRIIKTDINKYVEADVDVQMLSLKIGMYAAAEKQLEEILRQINNRNFLIKNIIEHNKFTAGVF